MQAGVVEGRQCVGGASVRKAFINGFALTRLPIFVAISSYATAKTHVHTPRPTSYIPRSRAHRKAKHEATKAKSTRQEVSKGRRGGGSGEMRVQSCAVKVACTRSKFSGLSYKCLD